MIKIAALEICANAAFWFGVAPGALSFADRRGLWARADEARAVALWLIRRRLPCLRTADIATLFDLDAEHGRDVIERSLRATAARLGSDPALARAVAEIAAELDAVQDLRAARPPATGSGFPDELWGSGLP